MANKQLTAKVRLNTTEFEQKLKRIAKGIDAFNNSVKKQQSAYDAVNRALAKSASQTDKVKTKTDKVATSANKVNRNFEKTKGTLDSIWGKLKGIVSTYALLQGGKILIEMSDTVTSAENRFNNLPNGDATKTADAMDKIYGAAQRSRSSYSDMLSNVSKTMTLAGDSFQGNIDNAIRFQEIMSKAYTIGGASSAEASTSMYQLVQALGSGILQGDELRSVREGAPIAYKAIEEFAQGVFDTDESLKDLASQGVITSDIIVAAMMNAEENINKSFDNTQMTFAQAWEKIKNTVSKALEPTLRKINDLLNSSEGEAIINGISNAFMALADAVAWVFGKLRSFIRWGIDNWEWLRYVILMGIIAIVAYIGYLTTTTIINAAIQAAAWVAVHWQFVLIIALIVALGSLIIWLANLTVNGAEFMILALLFVGLALTLIGVIIFLITGNWIMLAVGLVILAAAIIVALLWKCGDKIVGVIYWVGAYYLNILSIIWTAIALIINFILGLILWLGAMIINLVVACINAILQILWALMDPFIGIIEWILNVCQGGFDSFGGAVANLIGQIISWFLTLGKVVTKIIDAIFGTNWSDGLTELQNKVVNWGKNENAITVNRETPEIPRLDATDAFMFGFEALPYGKWTDLGDAYNKGAAKGTEISNGIEDFGTKLKDGIANFGEGMTGLVDPNSVELALNGAYDPNAIADDIANGLDTLGDISDDTSKISDSISLADDDLEFLRRIAEMEWRNEFTTAEIKVDMTNHNTVNGERDLDGIVAYLSDVLREEMTNVAYGVHY